MIKSRKNLVLLLLGGFLAGFANGLLGAGGGIIIIFVLSKALKGIADDPRDKFANALCIMLPLSITSTVIYATRGTIRFSEFYPYILPALIGGLIGGIMLDKINVVFLKKIFCAILIFSGIMLIIK